MNLSMNGAILRQVKQCKVFVQLRQSGTPPFFSKAELFLKELVFFFFFQEILFYAFGTKYRFDMRVTLSLNTVSLRKE